MCLEVNQCVQLFAFYVANKNKIKFLDGKREAYRLN